MSKNISWAYECYTTVYECHHKYHFIPKPHATRRRRMDDLIMGSAVSTWCHGITLRTVSFGTTSIVCFLIKDFCLFNLFHCRFSNKLRVILQPWNMVTLLTTFNILFHSHSLLLFLFQDWSVGWKKLQALAGVWLYRFWHLTCIWSNFYRKINNSKLITLKYLYLSFFPWN